MSQQYQVLARKYRSKNFHELVGQTHVSKALINAIDYNRLHHAYLFTGTRGIGKTTIARILSKCLNCETGITSTPCGICNTCTAIDGGRFIDLIEIDAASRTKVEDTRELIDNVPYAPTQGRFKVYLIDEVHMLSTHSFNALLKTLEEPPAHVKFLLATTDPQKLPITIISRCLQFVLRPLPQQAISDHLAFILTNEGIEYTEPALWQLANAAKGSMRDALSLTDQAIAFGQGLLTNDTVNDMLGLIDSADLISLLSSIYEGNTQAVSSYIEQMRMQLVDAGSMFDGLAELLHQLAMTQLLPNLALNVNDVQAAQIINLAQKMTADVLQLYYQIVIQGREQIKLANTPLQALEMCLLRLIAFRPLAVNEIHSITPHPNLQTKISVSIDSHKYLVDDINNNQSPSDNESESTLQDDRRELPIDNDNTTRFSNEVNLVDKIGEKPIDKITSELDDISLQSLNNINNNISTDVEPDVIRRLPNTDNKNTELLGVDGFKTSTNDSEVNDIVSNDLKSKNSIDNPTANLQDEILSEDRKISSNFDKTKHTFDSLTVEESTSTSNLVADLILTPPVYLDDNQHNTYDTDPRLILQSAPADLTGSWTPEKWDFWLQSARNSSVLAKDELALARQGVMEGNIRGKSTFKVAFDTKNMDSIFKQLASHLFKQFKAKVDIAIDEKLSNENSDLLPQTRQLKREIKAKSLAQELLMSSPVMQRLNNSHCQITSLKLLKM